MVFGESRRDHMEVLQDPGEDRTAKCSGDVILPALHVLIWESLLGRLGK